MLRWLFAALFMRGPICSLALNGTVTSGFANRAFLHFQLLDFAVLALFPVRTFRLGQGFHRECLEKAVLLLAAIVVI